MTDLLSGRRIFGNDLKRFIENSPELSVLYGSPARPFILFSGGQAQHNRLSGSYDAEIITSTIFLHEFRVIDPAHMLIRI